MGWLCSSCAARTESVKYRCRQAQECYIALLHPSNQRPRTNSPLHRLPEQEVPRAAVGAGRRGCGRQGAPLH